MSEHAGDVVAPRVSVDCAAGFIVAVLLGPGVEEVADLPRRVAGAATVYLEDEREEACPGRGADRGCGRARRCFNPRTPDSRTGLPPSAGCAGPHNSRPISSGLAAQPTLSIALVPYCVIGL